MKKLMILVSVIACACGLQAASFTWGFGSDSSMDPTGAGDEGYLNQGKAFLFLGTVLQTANADGTYTLDINGAKEVASATMNEDYTFGSPSATVSSEAVTGVTGIDYTLVLAYDSNASDLASYEGYYYLINGTSTRGYDPQTEVEWAQMTSFAPIGQGDWRTASVPEPTSGLLMLLGMAGLALRRKQK